jgi:glycosyltransferase involved in cell wall biosynthesis
MIELITPMLITFNEASNLPRVLEKLRWANKILVVDSGSTDETLNILRRYAQVDVFHRSFTSFADQCNFGLKFIATPWVLSLDSDYELSDELVDELKTLRFNERISGFTAPFVYRIYGQSLSGTIYPPRTVLYRKDRAVYRDEGHGHRVEVDGEVGLLRAAIYHDDRKPLARWMASQQRYARAEARYLLETPAAVLNSTDRIRLVGWVAPILVPIYVLVMKRCILDGWAGWRYALERLCFEVLVALEIVDHRIQKRHERIEP